MIIKECKYKKCKGCGRQELIKDEIHGCDCCGKHIDFNDNQIDYLKTTAHKHDSQSEDFIFCSWKCFFTKMQKIKTDYFISLPFLHFDTKTKGTHAKDFWKQIKEI